MCTKLSYQQEQEFEKARKQLCSFATHAIGTPLAILKAHSQQMIDEVYGKTTHKQKETIKKMLLYIQNIEQLMKDFSELSKCSPPIREKKGFLKLETVIHQALDDIRVLCQKKNIHLTIHLPSKPIVCCLQIKSLQHTLQCLLINAYHFTPPKGRISVSVRISTKNHKKVAILSIKDTGPSIAGKKRRILINTADMLQNQIQRININTGIELHTFAEYAKRLGGNLWVRDPSHIGATFSLTLPIISSCTHAT